RGASGDHRGEAHQPHLGAGLRLAPAPRLADERARLPELLETEGLGLELGWAHARERLGAPEVADSGGRPPEGVPRWEGDCQAELAPAAGVRLGHRAGPGTGHGGGQASGVRVPGRRPEVRCGGPSAGGLDLAGPGRPQRRPRRLRRGDLRGPLPGRGAFARGERRRRGEK
ncbi:unnamed protein product, partial [Effrenium voratum]